MKSYREEYREHKTSEIFRRIFIVSYMTVFTKIVKSVKFLKGKVK